MIREEIKIHRRVQQSPLYRLIKEHDIYPKESHILRQHPPHSFVMLFEVRREEVGAGAFSHLGSRADHNVPDLK